MPIRSSKATWGGSLKYGIGIVKLNSNSSLKGYYSYASRYNKGQGTNPEELLGAAYAGSYAMTLTDELLKAGYEPDSVEANAVVVLDTMITEPSITNINLIVDAEVPDINKDDFQRIVEQANEKCPVSKVLAGTDIEITAQLV